MANLLDVVIIGGGAYYLTNKLVEDKDLDFNRLLIGTAIGVPAAFKGPEIYESIKKYAQNSKQDQAKVDKVVSGVALGAIGYVLGDKFGDYMRQDSKKGGGNE